MNKFGYGIILFFALCGMQTAVAFELSPLRATLGVLGPSAEKEFTLKNTKNSPIAVTFTIDSRVEDINGKENNKNADASFIIYPPQTIIPPGGTQRVRIQWIGNTNLVKEQAYRFIAEEVPVKLSQKKMGIQMLLKIRGALYVSPKKVSPNIRVVAVKPVGKLLAINLQNTGTRHAYLVDPQLILTSGAHHFTMKGNTLKPLKNANILAGGQRRFLITPPNNFRAGNWKAVLKYTKIKN
jgi:fimbrial chaperone protein